MDYRRAEQVLEGIEATTLDKLKQGLMEAAVRYAHERALWQLAAPKERAERDIGRRAAHNAPIDACDILSRNMAKQGESVAWREALTDQRKEIGDFACFLRAILGVRAR